MSPFIPNGSFVLCNRWIKGYQIGQIIKFRHRDYGDVIKIIQKIDDHGFLWCDGLNQESVSMNQIGPVSVNTVYGVVVWVIKAA